MELPIHDPTTQQEITRWWDPFSGEIYCPPCAQLWADLGAGLLADDGAAPCDNCEGP